MGTVMAEAQGAHQGRTNKIIRLIGAARLSADKRPGISAQPGCQGIEIFAQFQTGIPAAAKMRYHRP